MAWHSLGWQPLAFSEIEPFPCKVLAHHYPDVPNLCDMTKFQEWPDHADVDLLVGGTPCQSFSIAGLRKGLGDPRGNLMLTYLAIAAKYRPRWLVWENVPGVLSSNGGRDFGTFLAGLAQCGYGFAYRVLDAQYVRTDGYPHAVPQRRRRVFVIGHSGSWQRAAAVLFDRESLRGDSPPRRKAGQTVAGTFTSRTKSGGWTTDVDLASSGYMQPVTTSRMVAFGEYVDDSTASAMKQRDYMDATDLVSYGLPGNWIGRKPENGGNAVEPMHNISPNLTSTDRHAVAFNANARPDELTLNEINQGLTCSQNAAVMQQMQVRRLTPTECARLQGFPDDYLPQVHGASDTAMYRALGNSMAVNVMQCIGQRIAMVESI